MKFVLPRIGLPLLAKELVEQAARPRTYIVRIVYAVLLFLAGFAFYYQVIGRYNSSPFAVLGKGRELCQSLIILQFIGVFIFMPAMTCGVVTAEKERSSLGLLFLTRLGPWTIVLEKYLGRIIPMFSFLILSLPLLVIAYSLGGISQHYLWTGVWFLALTTFQVGALAMLCSTFFRTTVGAFIGTYLGGIAMLFWLPLTDALFELRLDQQFDAFFTRSGNMGGWNTGGDWIAWSFMGPAIFEVTTRGAAPVWEIALASCPILVVTVGFLSLARFFLVRRAFVPPTNWVLNTFKNLDGFFVKLNDNRWTKGKVLISDNTPLHKIREPVAWRETTKTSLGTIRYLLRLFIVLETPVIFLGLLLIAMEGSHEPLSVMLMLLWIVATLIVSVKATSLVAGERSHETLDVLLTTPLQSSEIVMQKFRGVKRLILVVSVPLLTTILLKTMITQGGGSVRSYGYGRADWVLYLVCAIASVVIYLPMVAWLALFIGIRLRQQSKAIFATLATLVAWCAMPVFLLIMYFETARISPGDATFYLLLLGPATIIPVNEFFELERMFDSAWLAVIFNFVMYAGALFLIRAICLHDLDRHLGRSPGIINKYES